MVPSQLPFCVSTRCLSEVRLQVAEAGQKGSPLVILLHGFPDLWQGWHQQMAALAAAGFRVLAPNQRGYGQSDRPSGVAAYDLDPLARDVVDLADSEGCPRFLLVGHDWGGIIAWWVAARYSQRVEGLMVLNAPHPGIFQRFAWRHPSQLMRSWYVAAFQLRWLPEALLRARNHQLLFRTMQRTSQPGVIDESDRSYLTEGWSAPSSLTSMLNYYRALVRRSGASLGLRVSVPTRVLFGQHDPTEDCRLAFASRELCEDVEVQLFAECKHWPHREQPSRTNAELIGFLQSVHPGQSGALHPIA